MRNVHATKKRRAAANPTVSPLLAMLKRRVWLLAATLPFVVFWVAEYAQYMTLPDALFGGDAWAQLGIVRHIYEGNPPWTDSAFPGEWAFRDWLMFALVALVARLTFLDPLAVAIFWPLVPLVGGGICAYAIGKRLHRHEGVAVLMAVAWMGLAPYMAFQSSSFAAMLTVPLFLLALVSQDGSLKRRSLLGGAYAAASLSYLVAFFGCTLMLLVAGAWQLWRTRAPSSPGEVVRSWWPVAAIGLPVVLALWGPMLVAYGGNVMNPSHLYCDSCRGWNADQALGFLKDYFFDTSHAIRFFVSLAAAFGLYAAARQWDSHGGKWTYLVLAVGFVGTYHYLVTMPLLENHLVFFRWSKVFLAFGKVMLLGHAVLFVARDALHDEVRPIPVAVALSAVVLAAAILTPLARSEYAENSKVDDERTRMMLASAAWIRENAPEDAVFLALDQESFALHGLTGKQVVTMRRSHANPFVDMDQRMADAAVMLYGDDRARARELMDAYGVTHLYLGWHYEYNQDHLPLMTHPKYAAYWAENGIDFESDHWPYDPSGENVQRFDTIIATEKPDEPPAVGDFRLVYLMEFEDKPWIRVYERVR